MTILKDVTVLVTGASQGIGSSIALATAKAGARVALVDRLDSHDICQQLKENGADARSYVANVSNKQQVTDVFCQIVADFGGFNALVNNAGVQLEKPFLETDLSDLEMVMNTNVRGTFLMSKQAIGYMRRNNVRGRIINIASDLAYLGREQFSVYCASKAAVLSLTKSWAREFAPDILVNSICPGPVETAMLKPDQMSAEWLAKESDIPLGRIGQPEEIAGVAVFLLSDGANFITGQGIGVNGGSVMP